MACFIDRRLPLFAGAASLALRLATGCGGDGGGGTAGSGVPATPDAAWTVNLSSNGAACSLQNSTRAIGEVSDMSVQQRVSDGSAGAVIACSVAGGTTFAVNAMARMGPDSLTISIPSITKTASKSSPASGNVTYQSDATVMPYSGACDFYFSTPPLQGVDPGKIWVDFDCPEVTSGASSPPSTCPITQSVAVFENCSIH